jgi:iron complex outermembrane receptor protein
MFQMNRISRAAMLLCASGFAFSAVAQEQQAEKKEGEKVQQLEKIQITGSRIKRASSEGALPVTVVTRQQLDQSGATTVAEYMRNSTFSSAGNFRPQSGSSAQGIADVSLRGLGSERTLVLLDGKRLPKSPATGSSQDLNTVPLAAVERIEILTDGASAIYGSDAIGGVVNIITRKDFQGVEFRAGLTDPTAIEGGNRNEMSAIYGVSTETGSVIAGVSRADRGIVYVRNSPFGSVGYSDYGNNWEYEDPNRATPDNPTGYVFEAVPGGCTQPGFYLTPSDYVPGQTVCAFDFNQVAADEASIVQTSFFARGQHKINEDWSVTTNASVSRSESFGRYAPAPSFFILGTTDARNPTGGTAYAQPVYVYHRYAALGNRDTTTDNNVYDVGISFQGRLFDAVDLDVGVRDSQSIFKEFGRNFVVNSLASAAVNSGAYNFLNPAANSATVLNGMKSTINRDGFFRQREYFASATGETSFDLGGGNIAYSVVAENRKEKHQDLYDSLQEAGVIGGSAGNSSMGDREVNSMAAEFQIPFSKQLELSVAGRFDSYSDFGENFSPKASVRWQPMKSLTLRASTGQGFRAPALPDLYANTAFSASSVVYPVGTPARQVNTYIQSNDDLKAEKSTQNALGVVWDATDWLSIKADFYDITLTDSIVVLSAQDIINRATGVDPRPIPATPPGMGITLNSAGRITRVDTGYVNEGEIQTSGLDLSALMSFNWGDWGRTQHNFALSHVAKYAYDGDNIVGEAFGLPENRWTLSNVWKYGQFTLGWNINTIGENGRDITNASGQVTRAKIKEYMTHDLQASYAPSKNMNVTVGVLNVEDKLPQRDPGELKKFNFALYDAYGAQAYVRASVKF